jgi:hypothetical protein
MEVTRDIVIDLMPLYQSGEASPDTRAAIEEFLRRDPSLAKIANEDAAVGVPAGAELERRSVALTRATIQRRTWVMAIAILFTLLPFSFAFRGGEVTFFMLRDQPQSAVLLLGAAGLWLRYASLTRSLRTQGL